MLAVGDALSTYDVGWIKVALDGPEAATTALASLRRLSDLSPRLILPGHGPIPEDPRAAFATALRRAQRLIDDSDGAVWYAARRIFAYALMIYDGIPRSELKPYLYARAWVRDAARFLRMSVEAFSAELVETMLSNGAIAVSEGQVRATADYTPVRAGSLPARLPREWITPA